MCFISGARFALSNLNVTVTKTKLVYAAAPKTLRITKRIVPLAFSGVQNGTQNRQSGVKIAPFSLKMVIPKRVPANALLFVMHVGSFGSLLTPVAFQLVPFCFTFGIISYVFQCL